MKKDTQAEVRASWEKSIKAKLEGRRIVEVRYLTNEEAVDMSWSRASLVIFLDDGSNIVPMSDDEGNDAGAVSTSWKDLPTIPVMPLEEGSQCKTKK